MYASPVSLLSLPPPRRLVNRGKFAPAGRGRPLVILLWGGDGRWCAPAERGHLPELLPRTGTPARDAPARRGCPEATVWRILGALKERVIK
jgi:hypothetical protein